MRHLFFKKNNPWNLLYLKPFIEKEKKIYKKNKKVRSVFEFSGFSNRKPIVKFIKKSKP